MKEEKEIYIDVLGYDGYYQVSNIGNVKSLLRMIPRGNSFQTVNERVLKQTLKKAKNNNHDPTVMLSIEGIGKRFMSHRLIYCSFNKMFYDEVPDGYEICHLDKNSQNNNINNLSLEKKDVSQQMIYKLKGLSKTQQNQYQKRVDDYNSQENRKCKTCETVKNINDFYRGRKECKVCARIKMNEYDKSRRLSER